MTVRFCSTRLRTTVLTVGSAAACLLAYPALASAVSIGPITIGGGSSVAPGIPSVGVELPVGGGKSSVGVTVSGEGVKLTTPLTSPVEVHVPKVELPPSKVEPPKVEPPKVELPKVEVPKPPAAPPVTTPVGGVAGGGGGGVSRSGSTSSGASGASAGVQGATASNNAGSPAGGAAASHATTRSATRGSRGRGGGTGGASSGGPVGATSVKPVSAGSGVGALGAADPKPAAHRSRSRDPLSSLGASLPVPLPVPDWSKPIILLLALLAIAFGIRWWLASRRAGRLERRQRGLLRDIAVMQAALVPQVPARLQALEVSVAYRPAEGPAAGGDFYDVIELGPERVAVILGDVAGHGHDAVRQAALTRYTLRAFLKETGEPRAALALAGHALSEPGFEQLATVAIVVFDSSRGTLTYALAGHPPPLLLGVPAGDTPSACSSPPVGCELPTGRRQRTVSLPAGAQALLFSDGLIEARCAETTDGHPDLLGRERLAELFAALPPQSGARELLGAVREASIATPDDMAACILTSRAVGARRAIDHEILEVDGRAVADGHLSSYLRASGLAETDAERTLRATRTQLKSSESAILLVDRSHGEAEVGVRPGRERSSGEAAPAWAEQGRARLLRRV